MQEETLNSTNFLIESMVVVCPLQSIHMYIFFLKLLKSETNVSKSENATQKFMNLSKILQCIQIPLYVIHEITFL